MSGFIKYLSTTIALFCFLQTNAAVCISTGSGSWTNSATWSCGTVPTCGDSLVILSGHTVSITADNFTSCAVKMVLTIKGTLKFVAAGKLEFSCLGRVYVFSGGQVIASPGATGNVNAIMTCGSTWWNAAAGTYVGPGCMPATLPGCASVLPIELISFDATANKNGFVYLNWETVSEKNNDYFEIERSTDGTTFVQLQKVKSQSNGYSHNKLLYSVIDEQPHRGVNYYRLNQVDYSGAKIHFEIITVYQPGESSFSIYPNPNNGEFYIRLSSVNGLDGVKILLTNALGQAEAGFILSNTDNQEVIDMKFPAKLPAGIYICTVQYGNQVDVQKIIIN